MQEKPGAKRRAFLFLLLPYSNVLLLLARTCPCLAYEGESVVGVLRPEERIRPAAVTMTALAGAVVGARACRPFSFSLAICYSNALPTRL